MWTLTLCISCCGVIACWPERPRLLWANASWILLAFCKGLKTDLPNKNVFTRLNSLESKVQGLLNTPLSYFQNIGRNLEVHPSAKPAAIHAHSRCQLSMLRASYCILCRGGQGNEALSLARAEGQPCLGSVPTKEHISEQSNTGVAGMLSWQSPQLTLWFKITVNIHMLQYVVLSCTL